MRPFRFFFFMSLGIMLFFVVARFVVFAVVAAALLSFAFFIGRKIRNFFYHMSWEDDRYQAHPHRMQYQRSLQQPVWNDDLLVDYPHKRRSFLPNYQSIEVH